LRKTGKSYCPVVEAMRSLSRVIKSSEWEASWPVPHWQDAEARGRSYLERAGRRARAMLGRTAGECQLMLEEASQTVSSAREQAAQAGYTEGFAQGLSRGLEEARGAGEELLRQGREALDAAWCAREDLERQWEPELVELVIAISRQILRQELATENTAVLALVRGALEAARDETRVRLHAHPAYITDLEQAKDQLLAHLPGLRQLELVPDASLSPGAVVHGDWGAVDATVEAQLARARAQLLLALEDGEVPVDG